MTTPVQVGEVSLSVPDGVLKDATPVDGSEEFKEELKESLGSYYESDLFWVSLLCQPQGEQSEWK